MPSVFEVNAEMPKRKNITKYLLPVLFAVILTASLAAGILYIRSYLMQQTIEERSSQMEEMVSQIRANLDIFFADSAAQSSPALYGLF